MSSVAGRDVLVILRSELSGARNALRDAASVSPSEPKAKEIAVAVRRLTTTADALEARIKAPFDAVLLEKAAGSFRTAAIALGTLLKDRHAERRHSADVQRVLKRVVIHAREIGMRTHDAGSTHVGSAISALSDPAAWNGPVLDGLVGLVDTLIYLSRQRLGDQVRARQVSSLVDRAASTIMVSSLHALKELATRVRNEPTVMKDRFQLDGALKAPSAHLVDRLDAWFKPDDDGKHRLHVAIESFIRRLLDRASAAAS